MNLSGKRIAVLGAGGSGFAAATLALSHGAFVAAFDSGDPGKLAPAVEKFGSIGVELTCGDEALVTEERFDCTVISPGIDASWPIARVYAEASDELIGEIEFAWRMSDVPVIAITGTNGKTTTTSLVAEMLKAAGLRATAAGNIGLAYSEVVNGQESLDWIVLEVSSFQLETIDRFAPRVAVWMNFAPDHMDRYATVEEYRDAKLRIFRNAGPETLAITKWEEGFDFPNSRTFSAFGEGGDFTYRDGMIESEGGEPFDFHACELHGKHNAENVMVALAIADFLSLSRDSIAPAIQGFRAPRHRCEKVAVIDGVTWVNDSKSTNLHSLESALAGQESPVVLIVGGKEKGLDFSELNGLVANGVKAAVCIGEISAAIANEWAAITHTACASSVEAAVDLAAKTAAPGDVVLFSPGTSSFDMFRGYEARGDAFRDAVLSLGAA